MRTNIQQGIHQLRGKAVLYLTNEATASILMKPVQVRAVHVHTRAPCAELML